MNNFRRTYYSQLGVSSVETRPSLESALQGEVLDIVRLERLCFWVRIPHALRPIVWKVGCIALHCMAVAVAVGRVPERA